MELRSRNRKQHQWRKKQAVFEPIQQVNGQLFLIPAEVFSLLAARFLSQQDVAAAASTCKMWARVFRAGITRATLVVGGGEPSPPAGSTLQAMGKHTSVSDLQLLLNSRSDYSHINSTLSSLPMLQMLKRLQLRFLMSNTPKKGTFPIFFPDNLKVQQVESLSIQSPEMPHIALLSMILNLKSAWASKAADSSAALQGSSTPTPRHLDLRLGQPPSGSQLPPYAPPSWLVDQTVLRTAALDGEHLQQLSEVPSLVSLRCDIASTVLPSKFDVLSKLTSLSELVLYGSTTLSSSLVAQLPRLKSLRKLGFTMNATGVSALEGLDLDFVHDLNLGMVVDANGQALQQLFSRPPAGLHGLTVKGLSLQQSFVDQLAGLTKLTSLQLVDTAMVTAFLDLTAWRQLSGLQQLTLQVSRPYELAQIKFAPPPPPPRPERVLTGACQSVGKRRKSAAQQQLEQHLQQLDQPADKTEWGDVSAILAALSHLKALKLSGLSPFAVCETNWESLSRVTALTSLTLHFVQPSATLQFLCDGYSGLKQPPRSDGGALPILRVEHLPATLQEVLLTNCYVCVPTTGTLRAGEALRTVSLSKCCLATVTKGVSTLLGQPDVLQETAAHLAPTADVSTEHPLLVLLQQTPQLQMLELINLQWLTDAVLSAAAAQTQLRALSSLSVVGIGNQHLTHGALLGLTNLCKLRELRWHVGSVLELMPDVNALAQLKGLMTVHLPHWLHQQMERWGAYAVLDSMPLCDVNVELP